MKDEISNFNKEEVIKNLYQHVEHLSVKIGERHLWRNGSLDRAADYIEAAMSSCGYEVWRQTYTCYGKSVSNLIVEKEGTEKEVFIIGAHYDTVPGTPGADDNASGLAALLELARLHRLSSNRKTLVFAAFANEEPPCFGSPGMGSMVYATHLREQKTPVAVMISLEMIGYFTHEAIQRYPLPGLSLFYPKTGDYIGVVGNFHSSRYVSLFKRGIRRYSAIPSRSLTAPEFFGGINLSDNYSFWYHGYRAIMITDTSFFRNVNYHLETDTIETLHFERMAEVVRGLHRTLLRL
ncbi:MAG: M20/M25/M40 family metallo-hydrolase [Thermodesulfobacteriota bacterium]